MMSEIILQLDNYDAALVRGALRHYQDKLAEELDMLTLARQRDLTTQERELLPASLVDAPRMALEEQVDHWRSLLDHVQWLLSKMDQP